MASATAKYILTAEDQTKTALDSARRGFDSLDKSAKITAKGIGTLSSLFLGAGLISGIRRFTDAVVGAAAANDKEFAASLAKVDEATKKLLAPTSGLPAVKETLGKLQETLQSPELIAAADKLTSHVLTAWAKLKLFAAEAVAGWGLILNGPAKQSGQIDERMRALQDERTRTLKSFGVKDESSLAGRADTAVAYGRLLEIKKQLDTLGKQYWQTLSDEAAADKAAAVASNEAAAAIQRGNDARAQAILTNYRLKVAMAEVDEAGKYFDEIAKSELNATAEAIKYAESLREIDRAMNDELFESMDKFNDTLAVDLGKSLDAGTKDLISKTSEMSVYADQAARNMQTAFADFLFDPFEGGVRGMLKSFLDTMRRMLAEAAASKVFDLLGASLSKSGNSWLSAIGGAISGARADGGPVSAGKSYLVGERGPEIFTPGMSGGITPNGAGGAPVITYNIDARGATMELAAALPGILRQNNEALKADIFGGIQRRKYAV